MTSTAPTHAERKAAWRAELRTSLPDDARLADGLAATFGAAGERAPVVTGRRPNDHASSFPSEIVECRFADGRELRLLCKYGRGRGHAAFGHRGNVAYESEVYRRVLHPIQPSGPRWFGSYVTPGTGECWLVIEYLDGAVRLELSDAIGSFVAAARWIGRFHACSERRLTEPALGFLVRYDAEYVTQWARRTAILSAGLHRRFPWLPVACARFARVVDGLLASPTIIHGEYTPKNIMLHGERVCPVDWESAAAAPGEIDVASLTDGRWPPALVDAAIREYAAARWPGGTPTACATRLELARLYWNFRWLGERAEWTTSERGLRRIARVREIAVRAGLV